MSTINQHDDTGYDESGFLVRSELLTAGEVANVNGEVDRILAAGPRPGMVLEKDDHTLRSVFNPHLYSPVFARLTRHPRILEPVQRLLGDDVYTFQLVVNNKAAFNGDLWFWHQDYPTYRTDDHIAQCHMVNVLIFLDDVTQFNGPLMMVPGSHQMSSDRPQESTQGTSYKIRYTDRKSVV